MASEEQIWTDPTVGKNHVEAAVVKLNQDAEFEATIREIPDHVDFGISMKGAGPAICFRATNQKIERRNHGMMLRFALQARPEHWREFFSAVPKRPFQSYWGMLRVLGMADGVEVLGDVESFTKHARLWRIVLDRLRDTVTNTPKPLPENESFLPDDETDDDSLTGHYTWLTLPPLGKCKIFYEVSGQGPQAILFLHTAGADSRQYHSMMLNKSLQARYQMYAFDLPGHGRSFPGQFQYPFSYNNTEDFYINCIRSFLAKLNLKNTIVSGASMGGQICLAVALHARELNVRGVIPCEACAYIPSASGAPVYNLRAGTDMGTLHAERVSGMISPTSPEIYKRLNWWIYASQPPHIFPGDLRFYFDGWDGRDRMAEIDTERCPVYMLTGEYDYSCTVEMSRETAGLIERGEKGRNVVMREMEGVGHFPFSEGEGRVVKEFAKAVEWILERGRA